MVHMFHVVVLAWLLPASLALRAPLRTSPTRAHARSALLSPRDVAADRVRAAASPLLVAATALLAPLAARAGKPVYLAEPTKEFKDELLKTDAFNSQRTKDRAVWDEIVSRLAKSETSKDLEALLIELKGYLTKLRGVPPSYNKMDLVKLCRTKKLIAPGSKSKWDITFTQLHSSVR